MSFFGFGSKKEAEEKERKERMAREANLAKNSQVEFGLPFFDVVDPRFENFAVPVSVQGVVVYAVDDIDRFNSINKTDDIKNATFQENLKAQVRKYVKSVVVNAPADNQIPVLLLERKILEISALAQSYVTPQVERLFGINVRSIDITSITIDKESRGYRELKAVTTDIESQTIQTRSSLGLSAMKRQQEMALGGQEEMQRMQLEHQRETMRIQREELQRASRLQTETNFLGAHQANLNASVQAAQGGMFATQTANVPPMPGMPPMPGSVPPVQYMVGVNGQQVGPCDWNQLQQMVQQGQLTHQTYVWKQGMPQWQMAGEVQELTALFS
ncbi:MAG: DUF4339 domain-containing protein [Bacteroidaceae bacterium]|nr:DUF4339 domain-containing protein [Bacteroidaceae bacterium]